MPGFPEGGRWAVFFGPGTLVDTGIPVFRPPRVVDAATGLEAEDHEHLLIARTATPVNLTIGGGRKAGFKTTLVQADDGCMNVLAGEGVLLEPENMATGGKGSVCFLYAIGDDDFLLVGQTGPAEPVDGGEAVGPPVNRDIPYVGGTGTVGSTLTCTMGNWEGTPDSYTYAWKQIDEPGGAMLDLVGSADAYVVAATDVGHGVCCVVTATNAAGSTEAPPSNAVSVA
jgi:hypothetical protein